MPPQKELTLREKQSLFVRLLGQLYLYTTAKAWEFTLADGSIDPLRRGRPLGAANNVKMRFRDTVHMEDGLHYERLAQDLNLFIDGVIHPVDCKEWRELGAVWKGFHPLCRWGGDFESLDFNHFSLTHDGKS